MAFSISGDSPYFSLAQPVDGGSAALPPPPVSGGGSAMIPAPPPPTAPSAGGYQIPSLATILGGDPLYQQALANLNATSVQSAAQRDAARSRALIGFGAAPDLSGLQGLVGQYTPDAQTLALAQQNTQAGLSTQARLHAADEQARQQIMNVLGARGLYNSGETGYQYGKEATGYRQSQYDATQKLVDYLAGVQQSYLQAVQQQQMQQYQLEQQALQNWLAMNPYGTGGTGGTGSGTTFTDVYYPSSPPTTTAYDPYAVSVAANPTGASANTTQGVFSIH